MIKRSIYLFLTLLASTLYSEDDLELYDDPALRGDTRWISEMQDLLEPVDDSFFKPNPDQQYVELFGRFTFFTPITTNQALRLRPYESDARVFRLFINCGSDQYRLERHPELGGTLVFYKNNRRVCDDRSRWHAYHDGMLDIRIDKDQRISFARGTRCFMEFPLSSFPRDMMLDYEGRIDLFQLGPLPDIPPFVDTYASPGLDLDPAAALPWQRSARDRYSPPEDGSNFSIDDAGAITFVNPHAKDHRRLSASFTAPGPCVVTCRIESVSEGAGLAFANYNRGTRMIYFAPQDDAWVLCNDPNNEGDVEHWTKRAAVYQTPFFLRGIYGLDFLAIEVSQDGEHWAHYDQHHIGQKYSVPNLFLELNLRGGMEGKKQHLRLSHAHVHATPLLKQRPSSSWEQESNRTLLNAWGPADIRQAAAIDYLHREIGQPDSTTNALRTLDELSPWIKPQRWGGHSYSIDPEKITRALGAKMIAENNLGALQATVDAWHDNAYYLQAYRQYADRYEAPPLIRRLLYDAWDKGDWLRLRREAQKYFTLARPGKENLFATWMFDQANEQLGESTHYDPDSLDKRLWPHPLRISSDRSTMNMLGEMHAALEHDEVDLACKVLTRHELSDQFVSSTDDNQLYKPARIMIKELIDAHPAMQQNLIDRFTPVGMIRVGRAEQAGDAQALDRLAHQFHGTAASRKALSLLGDRDLSMGNFPSAIERFSSLIPFTEEGTERDALLAKQCLAEVLNGIPASPPPSGSVELPGGNFTAEQFALLLDEMQQPAQAADAIDVVSAPSTSLPMGNTVLTNTVLELPFLFNESLALAHQGKHLALQQKDHLVLVDIDNGTVQWEQLPDKNNRYPSAFAPQFDGEHLVTTLRTKESDTLTAFNLDGTVAWQHRLPGRAASNPVQHNDRLYLISRSADEHLYVNRLHPMTGAIELRRSLLRHPRMEKTADVIHPAFVGEHLVIAARGLLLACNPGGEVQWIRRIPYIPYKVDRQLLATAGLPQIHAIDDQHAVVCAPCSPEILCLNVQNGKIDWKNFQPDRQHLVSATPNQILLRNQHAMAALNPDNGEVRWQIPAPEPFTAFISGNNRPLLHVRLDRIEADSLDPKSDVISDQIGSINPRGN